MDEVKEVKEETTVKSEPKEAKIKDEGSAEKTEVEKQPQKKASGKNRNKLLRILLGIIMCTLLAIVVSVLSIGLGTRDSGSAVGNWQIIEVTAGAESMSLEDANNLGITEIGYFRLNNSGTCEIKILDFETEGEWTEGEDGVITIKFGEEETIVAQIDEEGVMTAKDDALTEYKLEK